MNIWASTSHYLDDKTIELTQPQLIQKIIEDSKIMQKKFVPSQTLGKSSQIFQRHKHSIPHDRAWHYRSLIGKMNYLEGSFRPDIVNKVTVHRCTAFPSDPKIEHAQAVRYLVQYLAGTKNKGFIMKLDSGSGPMLDVYANEDFSG